jgi:hypothetical protein
MSNTFQIMERQGKIVRASSGKAAKTRGKAKKAKGGRRPIQLVQVVRDKRKPVELPTDSLGYEVQAFRKPTLKGSRMSLQAGVRATAKARLEAEIAIRNANEKEQALARDIAHAQKHPKGRTYGPRIPSRNVDVVERARIAQEILTRQQLITAREVDAANEAAHEARMLADPKEVRRRAVENQWEAMRLRFDPKEVQKRADEVQEAMRLRFSPKEVANRAGEVQEAMRLRFSPKEAANRAAAENARNLAVSYADDGKQSTDPGQPDAPKKVGYGFRGKKGLGKAKKVRGKAKKAAPKKKASPKKRKIVRGGSFTTDALALAAHGAIANPTTSAVAAIALWNMLDQSTKYALGRDVMQAVGGVAWRYWEAVKNPTPVDWDMVKKEIRASPRRFVFAVLALLGGAAAAGTQNAIVSNPANYRRALSKTALATAAGALAGAYTIPAANAAYEYATSEPSEPSGTDAQYLGAEAYWG